LLNLKKIKQNFLNTHIFIGALKNYKVYNFKND